MKIVRLALVSVLVLCANALGSEPQIGDSVMVISDQAEVRSKHGTLGIAPIGTEFSVKQKSGPWLLGLFQIGGRSAWGWMKPSSVRVLEHDISQQPVHEFTWHNLLLARAKIDAAFNLEDHVDDYMEAARNRVWQQCRNDEFQLERRRIETLTILRKRLTEFDLERDFLIKTNLTFQEYDFKGAKFPIKEATTTYYWYESADEYTDSLPGRLKVFINDPQLISGIPMEPTTAERFLAIRKSRGGYINREVYANIRVRITGVRSSGELESDVRWAQFFSDRGRTRLLYETPQSPIQFKAGSESAPPAALPSVQKAILPNVQPAVRQPVLPGIRPSVIAAAQINAVPATFPMAQPATFAAVQPNSLRFTQQPFQQGQS